MESSVLIALYDMAQETPPAASQNSGATMPSHALSVLSTVSPPHETSSPAKSDLRETQGKLIIETYQRCHGNVVHTARELAVSRNTVYRELRRSGLR